MTPKFKQFNLGKRRLRKFMARGYSTYAIGLPKFWVVNNGLEENGTIELKLDEEGNLIIVPVKGNSNA